MRHLFTEITIQIEQKNTIFYIVLPDSLNIAYVLDTVQLSYIYMSPENLIFAAAADKNYASIESLAQDINLSPSYTYKSLNTINQQLSYFRVKIAFDDFSKKSNVYGTEADIRFFFSTCTGTLIKESLGHLINHQIISKSYPCQSTQP